MDYGPKGSPAVGRALPGLPVRGRSAASNANPTTAWVRNVDWPANPIPAPEGFSGLYAVYDNASNFVALSAAGNYTVNWGDGTGNTNVSSGVQAETNIVYANVSGNPVGTSSAVACTFTDSGDTVNLTAHGWQNGQVVNFAAITSTTGISTFTKYYIVNRAADTFQVSTTIGGGAVALTTDGSGTVFVPLYKVATITIVPNGGALTNINLQKIHSQSGLSTHSAPWLDIAINGANLTTLNISTSNKTINIYDLEVFQLSGGTITDFSHMFNSCYSLTSVPLLNTAAGTDFSNMFNSCYSLTSAPLLNTASGTNFTSMFGTCYSLTSVPLLNTAAGTNFSYMFNNCRALTSVPLLNTAAGTNFSYMFYSCYSLTSAPLLNTASGTNFTSMFGTCYSLTSVPLLNTAAGTGFSNMFNSCLSLTSVPLLNTAAGTNFSYMFNSCYSLTSVPLLNTAAGTNFSYMFYNCRALTSVPLLNTAAGTDFSYMFNSCLSLASVPLLNTAAGTDFSNMFYSCPSLARGALSGTTRAISYSGCKLSAAELNEIYTNLGTAAGAQTITVTGNYGVTGDTPTIATGKGWTVTG